MTKKLELGICLFELRSGKSQEVRPWDLLEAAEWADEAGLEYLALPDRVSRPVPRFDTLTLMAALALRTQRIRLKTHVFVTPLRHPIELARRIVTVDHLSGGRFIFAAGLGGGEKVEGAGVSVYHKEFVDVGIPRKERGRRTNEILEILRLLWTEPVASFQGKYFQFQNVVFEPKPFQKPHPPIWVGGNSEAALSRAARFANGWAGSLELATVIFGSFPAALSRLKDLMRDEGREGEPMHISVCLKVNINPDAETARREAAEFWDLQLGSIEGAMPFGVKEEYGVYGPSEALVDRLAEIKAMGVNSVILHLHSFELKAQLRRLGKEVLPRV
ncbi:MAG: TIGR03619 family F420-dependent LLM class oxidoreductase [Deltaproteobacteria bacterium]|nr:TIGR03619 family F420-dependent LLM class oxidoreductase [Deltaproteobacteria bacterium]